MYQKAVIAMKHSANLGNLDAINALAIYFLKGIAGNRNQKKAEFLFEYAKSMGSSMAERNLKRLKSHKTEG